MNAAPEESRARLHGIGLFCLAVSTFALLDTSAKYASRFVPAIEVSWVRYAVNFILVMAVLRPWRSLAAYRSSRPLMQMARSVLLLGTTILNFLALRDLQLAETMSITFAAPLLVTALSGPLLGHWAGPRRWAAVAVGFVGVLVIVEPGSTGFHPAMILSIASTLCYAVYLIVTRSLAQTETTVSLLLYSAALPTVLLAPALPGNLVPPPSIAVAVTLALTGVFGGVGHWLVVLANRQTTPIVLAPFLYTELILMVLLGFLVFGDLPGLHTLIGATIVIASGLYILYRERVRGGI